MDKEKAVLQASTTNELLLAALRQEDSDELKDLSAAEWEELIQLAARLSLMPLLYQHLRHINMPEESAKQCRNAALFIVSARS